MENIENMLQTPPQKANPLLSFARTIDCSVKLPSNGKWYPEGFIEYNQLGEVNILPMIPKDEVLLKNSEALLSGDAIIEVIKSCVPSIKDPSMLLYPDVNVLMLGIQKATYGDTLKQASMCPNCSKKLDEIKIDIINDYMKKNNIENEKDITEKQMGDIKVLYVDELKNHKELSNEAIEAEVSITDLLSKIDFLPENEIYELNNGIKIYLTPIKLKDKIKFSNMNIQTTKINDALKERFEDATKNNDLEIKKEIALEMNKTYEKLVMFGTEIITDSIEKIELPDGTFVFDTEQIKEFVQNTNSNYVNEMKNRIIKLSETGLQKTIEYECPYCHNKWVDKLYGFNASDFFGSSSWF